MEAELSPGELNHFKGGEGCHQDGIPCVPIKVLFRKLG